MYFKHFEGIVNNKLQFQFSTCIRNSLQTEEPLKVVHKQWKIIQELGNEISKLRKQQEGPSENLGEEVSR